MACSKVTMVAPCACLTRAIRELWHCLSLHDDKESCAWHAIHQVSMVTM
jgi:hypothetical protein